MERASFETSKLLKESGFPQLEPKIGQVRYDSHGHMFVIMAFEGKEQCCAYLTDGNPLELNSVICFETFYAPSATEILRELGDAYSLYYISKENRYIVAQDGKVSASSHENAAEAAAMEYLKKKSR